MDLLDTLSDKKVVEKMKVSIRSWLDKTYLGIDKMIAQLQSLSFSARVNIIIIYIIQLRQDSLIYF